MRYEPIWYGWDLLLFSLFPFFNFNKNTQHTQKKKHSRTNSFVTFVIFFYLFPSWLFFLLVPPFTRRSDSGVGVKRCQHTITKNTSDDKQKHEKKLHDEYTCFEQKKNTRLTSWWCRNSFGDYQASMRDRIQLVWCCPVSFLSFSLFFLFYFYLCDK